MFKLLEDRRNIVKLILANGDEYWTGDGSTKRIEVYEELGQGSYMPWFAVLAFGGNIIARVNAAHVAEVIYE